MKPLVGMLYNPVAPSIIDYAPELVEYVEVIPDRLWYDFGPSETSSARFRRVHGAIEEMKRAADGRIVAGHGIGLSLPSAMPIDLAQVDQVSSLARELDFQWYSEHLSVFVVPKGSVPNSQAGLGMPAPYDSETFDLLASKLRVLGQGTGCDLMMENGSFFTPIPDMPMNEPQFLNRLYEGAGCGTLLDLHNLYVTWRNAGMDPAEYLGELNPDCVHEIHLGGGDMMAGFYADSHSNVTPRDVWAYAYAIAPRLRNVRAITFEFHESYFEKIRLEGITAELERMHLLADAVGSSPAYEEVCLSSFSRR